MAKLSLKPELVCDHCGTPDGVCRVEVPPDGVTICRETNRVVEGELDSNMSIHLRRNEK